MRNSILLFLLFASCVQGVKAQKKTSTKLPLSVALTVGTSGFGVDIKKAVTSHFFVKGGLSTLSTTQNLDLTTLGTPSGFKANLSAKVDFTNFHVLGEFAPFHGTGFRLVGGAGYFTKSLLSIGLTPTSDYVFKKTNTTQTITTSQIGDYHLDVDWKGIAPYVGIALFKAFPKNAFNVTLDLGTYILPQPKVTVIANGSLKPNEASAAKIQENMSDYTWLPNLQLNFNYKF